MKTTLGIIVGAVVLFVGLLYIKNMTTPTQTSITNSQESVQGTTDQPETKEKLMKKPEMQIDPKKTYTAKFTTTAGNFTVELNAKSTPITVNNFVYLARNKFYENTIFHRVISGFMIQGGDPTGTGAGGPGYKFNDEPFEGDYRKGVMAMANAGPNTNGSQFFIMHADRPLPKDYVIFGEVMQGIDVIDKIATAPVTVSDSGENSKPVKPVIVKTVEIVEE